MELIIKENRNDIMEGGIYIDTTIIFKYKDERLNFDFEIEETKNLPTNPVLKTYFLADILIHLGYRIKKVLDANKQEDFIK